MSLHLLPKVVIFVLFVQSYKRSLIILIKAERTSKFTEPFSRPFHLALAFMVHLLQLSGMGLFLPKRFNMTNRDVDLNIFSEYPRFLIHRDNFPDLVPFRTHQLLLVYFPATGVLVELKNRSLQIEHGQPLNGFDMRALTANDGNLINE